jgi:hypothetical protein
MRPVRTVRGLENLGRTRLSRNFFMREFMFSEIAAINGFPNLPDNPDLAVTAGRHLCELLLEPLQATFGRISLRSGYRAPEVNEFGNLHDLSCATKERDRARHIWDQQRCCRSFWRDGHDCHALVRRQTGRGETVAIACMVDP